MSSGIICGFYSICRRCDSYGIYIRGLSGLYCVQFAIPSICDKGSIYIYNLHTNILGRCGIYVSYRLDPHKADVVDVYEEV